MERTQAGAAQYQDLNPVIHERTRLAIMTYLMSAREAAFTEIRDELGLTDGNLNLHMKVLEKNGFVEVEKTFIQRRPRTTYSVTTAGQRTFQSYVALLERILKLKGEGRRSRDGRMARSRSRQ
jgi:DNA-binding MarR family transcriptional regulator